MFNINHDTITPMTNIDFFIFLKRLLIGYRKLCIRIVFYLFPQEVDTIKRCQEEMRKLIQDTNNQLA